MGVVVEEIMGRHQKLTRISQIMYGVLYAISPEIFPAKDRGTGNALVSTTTRVFGVVVRIKTGAPRIEIAMIPIDANCKITRVKSSQRSSVILLKIINKMSKGGSTKQTKIFLYSIMIKLWQIAYNVCSYRRIIRISNLN